MGAIGGFVLGMATAIGVASLATSRATNRAKPGAKRRGGGLWGAWLQRRADKTGDQPPATRTGRDIELIRDPRTGAYRLAEDA